MADAGLHLPETLEWDGTFADMVAVTHGVYENDFVHRRLMRDGLPVHRDRRILADGDGKEEAYWHLVQRRDRRSGERVPDFCRASRICWTRPIIECAPCDDLVVFDYDSGAGSQGGLKTYLWLQADDFLVILKKQPRQYFLVTSFCITMDWLRRDLEDKYRQRV